MKFTFVFSFSVFDNLVLLSKVACGEIYTMEYVHLIRYDCVRYGDEVLFVDWLVHFSFYLNFVNNKTVIHTFNQNKIELWYYKIK